MCAKAFGKDIFIDQEQKLGDQSSKTRYSPSLNHILCQPRSLGVNLQPHWQLVPLWESKVFGFRSEYGWKTRNTETWRSWLEGTTRSGAWGFIWLNTGDSPGQDIVKMDRLQALFCIYGWSLDGGAWWIIAWVGGVICLVDSVNGRNLRMGRGLFALTLASCPLLPYTTESLLSFSSGGASQQRPCSRGACLLLKLGLKLEICCMNTCQVHWRCQKWAKLWDVSKGLISQTEK